MNAALKDGRDGFATMPNLGGSLPANRYSQSLLPTTQRERWQEMIAWVNDGVQTSNHVREGTCSCLQETLKEIKELALLEEDWNDERTLLCVRHTRPCDILIANLGVAASYLAAEPLSRRSRGAQH